MVLFAAFGGRAGGSPSLAGGSGKLRSLEPPGKMAAGGSSPERIPCAREAGDPREVAGFFSSRMTFIRDAGETRFRLSRLPTLRGVGVCGPPRLAELTLRRIGRPEAPASSTWSRFDRRFRQSAHLRHIRSSMVPHHGENGPSRAEWRECGIRQLARRLVEPISRRAKSRTGRGVRLPGAAGEGFGVDGRCGIGDAGAVRGASPRFRALRRGPRPAGDNQEGTP